ncbi:GntR family transcriptional regulator [Agrobacterium vitis]|uniref:FCD domain-containing protein n=1 Tax=Agrobacterium vitis TaxID=373 RepID=A0AAE4WIF7_AGRVI|nr:GntR family transcriptional regulator [Agrobacterium vitis]MCF1501802.1 GntR family transcriptional regulator [Allorhizobium sp. Av2]MCM2443304.1 GntR family transcriptional regulator [Agrobacterium vitis]MUZ60934.1 FCD domain-containing protein [Agrobacterium vitis]MVA69208.1 FCD domain-containing protein [Agrobacterium vitis]MVA90221.1 FCD domain-containing protein [Agrobacterium vitis]
MDGGIEHPGFVAFMDALIDGKLKLGQTLTQEELCEVLGISLSPLREAVTLLEAEGIVQVRRRLGVVIFYPDVKFVGGTFQFRELLESEGLRRLAKTVPNALISALITRHHDMLEFVQHHPKTSSFAMPVKKLEQDFHGSFIAAFDNAQITANYFRLSQKMYLLRLLNPEAVNAVNTVKSMQEHLAVLEALEARDADGAVDALQKHLKGVLHRLIIR